ncbi:FkbM family methyltransferase [Paragemmobacter ruber]|uniref:FkbM family methyltransferase n=1 Tax=Paragemmobacter ruber TaxID=1985673 RepID=A0ABW9Y810_9RHOB|nr:FkbM family methyltransferase [Rhodobacter ruber]NBE08650.1 FkbM family methyltransferase [Rhodobacter ruber]
MARHVLPKPSHQIMPRSEQKRIERMPRFVQGTAKLFGQEIMFTDSSGFMHSFHEIFEDQLYAFHSPHPTPLIVDVGSNIGLSIIFFKRQFPDSRIIAFEPDPDAFQALEANVAVMGYRDVDLRNTAAWVEDTELEFFVEGSLAGSTEVDFRGAGQVRRVRAERLHAVLARFDSIDFLKMDIEGAENTVLFDLLDVLPNTKRLFLEYHGLKSRPQRLGDILNALSTAGFRYSIKDAAPNKRRPFSDASQSAFDPQLNIFCVRA